jgi:predicted cupin superfamily sugar epimerase
MRDPSRRAAPGTGHRRAAPPVSAAEWIRRLELVPHPEGGFYRETYRASERVAASHLPARFGGERSFSTSIYFLLPAEEVSALHRIKSDEVWHFYAGAPLDLFVIGAAGHLTTTRLGPEGPFQALVPAGAWYGAAVSEAAGWSLVGGTVAPGFDFADFELGERAELLRAFPQHRALIERLTP